MAHCHVEQQNDAASLAHFPISKATSDPSLPVGVLLCSAFPHIPIDADFDLWTALFATSRIVQKTADQKDSLNLHYNVNR